MNLSQKDAAKYLLQIRKAEDSFVGFVEAIHPEWDIPDFQYTLMHALDLLEKRKLTSGFTGETTKDGKLTQSNFKGDPVPGFF